MQGTRKEEEELPVVCSHQCNKFLSVHMRVETNVGVQARAYRFRDCVCPQGTRRRAKRPKQAFQSLGFTEDDGGLEIEIEDWSEGQWVKQTDVRSSQISESEPETEMDTPVVRTRFTFLLFSYFTQLRSNLHFARMKLSPWTP